MKTIKTFLKSVSSLGIAYEETTKEITHEFRCQSPVVIRRAFILGMAHNGAWLDGVMVKKTKRVPAIKVGNRVFALKHFNNNGRIVNKDLEALLKRIMNYNNELQAFMQWMDAT
jgi:hypothetical protein